MAKGSSSAARYKAALEEARAGARKSAGRLKERASKAEVMQAGAAIGGGALHGYARGSGYSTIAGVDVGYGIGGVLLVASQTMRPGTGRTVALGLGSGMLAATVSEAAEDMATQGGA